MKKILIILVLSLLVSGCSSSSKEDNWEDHMVEGEYIIVDVRTSEEYNVEHLSGAINIPYDEIDENVKLDKSKTIYVYCRSGARSEVAFNTLKNLGYKVYDLGAFSEIDLPKEK